MESNLVSKFSIKNLGLKFQLQLFALGISLIVAFVLSFTFLYFAEESVVRSLEAQMNSIRETKKRQVLSYFNSKQTDIFALATSSDIRVSFLEFSAAFDELGSGKNKINPVLYLQEKYIFENPNPNGKKDEMLDANDGSEYSKVHRKHHSYFRRYIKDKFFYDIFLIDLDGNIVYSVFKELDYATNLNTGKYRDTNLGKIFRETRNSRDLTSIQFADFENYAPSNDDPASFISAPILANGKMIGVLALQMPIDEINASMYDEYLGDHGAVYIVGQDYLFRTADHRYPNKAFILRQRNEIEAVKLALSDQQGMRKDQNYNGEDVFVSYGPLSVFGGKFALICEFEVDYAVKPLNELKQKVIFVFLITTGIVVFLTYLLTRALTRPITRAIAILSSSTRQIAATVEQQERTAQMQSASVNETSTTMAELGSSARHTAEQSVTVSDKSREAQETAKSGSEKVGEMVGSMEDLSAKVAVISEQILKLSEKNNQIGNIIGLVSDIANQTNMLALNAAVEAARAGEYGKGFAVVAGEIRKLADESKRSAEKIQEILLEIKKATDSTVMATEEGNKKVFTSMSLGRQVVEAFEGVFLAINTVFTSTEQITLNVKQQSIAINEVVQAVNSLNRGSQETATGLSQTKTGIQQVREATVSMKLLVDGKTSSIL